MITRNLGIALLISLGVHIFGMTAITIVTPEDFGRMEPYTRVSYLGPILKKTAFDIMLENTEPVMTTSYRYSYLPPQDGYLKVAAPKKELTVYDFPGRLKGSTGLLVKDFLIGSKGIPGFTSDFGENREIFDSWGSSGEFKETGRRVIYRPEASSIAPGFYGNKDTFTIKVKVLVDSAGKVKNAEPLTTTGFPRLDIIASKFAKSWIFEPEKDVFSSDEWHIVEVTLKTSSGE